nr:ABC transporter ATP-binding protein [Aquariibacter albus]
MMQAFETRVDPYPDSPPPQPPATLAAFLWAGTEGMRPWLAGMVLLTACIGAFEAWLFGLMGQVVDLLAAVDRSQLWSAHGELLLGLAGLLLASTAVVALQVAIKHQTLAGSFPMRLRWQFHRRMLGQSLAFYSDEFAGRIATKVMQGALAVRDTVFIVGDILVFVTLYFATIVGVLGGLALWLLLPFALWLAAYLLAVRHFVPRLGRAAQAQADARSLMTGRITDAYTNIATVKLFSHGQREAGHARGAMQDFLVTVHRQMRLVTGFEIVNHGLSMLLIGGTAGTALWLWTQQAVGLGAVAAATAMALRLNGMSHWIMWETASLFEHIGTAQDAMNTLSRPHSVVDRPGAPALQVQRGEIVFERVAFSYGRAADPAAAGRGLRMQDFNLHIRPGEKIGLVGRSGAGKSTLVHLLLRFYDLEGGRILIDGQDIAGVRQDSLRAQIGMVTQDTALLHRSVRENILYGRPDADEAALHAAAERAQAAGFIAQLRDAKGRSGYEAQVGERGVKLSGGQRQRIAIARVMLKDAPILLLDEATSALDSEVEQAIQASLGELMAGKTVVAIAHRLSTIAAMDRLVVMDQGRIVESGDHRSLLARGGLYARLWAHQSGGFLGEDDDEAPGTVSSAPPAAPTATAHS